MNYEFADVRALVSLKYFYETADGFLHLNKDIVKNIIDFHTHIGWDLYDQIPKELGLTVFPRENTKIDISHYSAFDYTSPLIKSARRMTLSAVLSRGRNKNTSASHLLLEMNNLLISSSVVLAIDIFGSINSSIVLNSANKEPKRIVPFVSLHPRKRNKNKIIESYIKDGARGIKIHPPMQRIIPDGKYTYEIAELAKEYHLPILFHCGYSPLAPKWQKKFTNMESYKNIISWFPEVTFILGHSGINEWDKALEIAKNNERVFLELSGQPVDVIKTFIKKLGSDRLLFGSDWPYYPTAMPLAKVLLATEGNEKAREMILYKNAERLLENYR